MWGGRKDPESGMAESYFRAATSPIMLRPMQEGKILLNFGPVGHLLHLFGRFS